MVPHIEWKELTDDELAELSDLLAAERLRRWQASRQRSWIEDIRARVKGGEANASE